MNDEAKQVQTLTVENQRLQWRISTLENAEYECVRLVEALRVSEDRYRKLLEEAGFPIIISTTTDSSVLYANPLACDFFGLAGPVPAGRRMVEFYLQASDRAELVRRLRSEGVVRGFEVVMRDGAGRSRDLLLSGSLLSYEGQEAVLATSDDITGRKQAEALFRTMVETSVDAFTIVDLSGAMQYASPQTLNLLGCRDFEEVRGRNFLEFIVPADHDRVRQRMEQVMAGRHAGAMEVTGLRRDGSTVAHESNAEVLRNPDGSPHAFFFVTRDLTARKRAERALRLAEKLEGLGLMAAGIAHDLNNAFQVVQGHLEIAHARRRSDAELDRILAPALKGLERSAALARNMLAYSGKADRVTAPFDLPLLVQESLALWQDHFPAGLVCRLHAEAGLPSLNGDEGQVARVVSALLLNAIDAMAGKDGAMDLSLTGTVLTEADQSQGVWLLPAQGGRFLCLEVRDQGCGFPELQAERIADPFYTTKGPGRGLGLSVTLGILRGHGGGLQVLSRSGEGTILRAYFPLEEEPPRVPARSPLLTQPARGILVAEDDEFLRELVIGMLREWGFSPVFAANDGFEALDLFRAHGAEIGLFLTDATMPRLTGPEALASMRQVNPGLRAVLMTGYAAAFGQRTAASFGFSSCLQKPFRLAELRSILDECLPNPGNG